MANVHAMPRISSAAPDLFAGYAAELGALWYDDVNLLWKKCTSTSPLTFSSIEGGGGVSDGDKGDITVSGGGATWTIDNGVVTAAKTSITGTPNGTKYLRDDFSWQAVSGGSGLTHPQVIARSVFGGPF